VVDVGGRRWICRLALSSNSDVVGTISLWCLGSLAGGLSSGVRPLHQNTPFLWQSSCSGCDAFDHPAALAGYSYKLDRWTSADTLLNSVFGKPWSLANARFGRGLFISAILFAGTNGLVEVDSQLHGHVVLPAAIAPFLLSLVSGWVRERSDSVWPSVSGHNLSNIVVPFASLFV
jgi:hypothetical protein